MDKPDINLLDGYVSEADWAAAANVTPRTTYRYRTQPNGLPYLEFAGKVYIPIEESREWLRSRIQRPNRRRTA